MDNEDLVSVIVITYNSSRYVLQTLESLKRQTYVNIELIISDDSSVDNTVDICRSWLVDNGRRFSRVDVITCDKNTGIVANCNRGVAASKGKWIKLIAGDDILFDNCIEKNYDCAYRNNAKMIVSAITAFSGCDGSVDLHFSEACNRRIIYASGLSAKSFKKWMVRFTPFLNSPTFFISKSLFLNTGGYDSEFIWIEDLPLILQIMRETDICFMNEPTVRYRVHENSVTRNNEFNYKIEDECLRIYEKYCLPELSMFNLTDIYLCFLFYIKKRYLISGSPLCKFVNAYGRSFLRHFYVF